MSENKHNFYNAFFEAYKALDRRAGEDAFPHYGFRFDMASKLTLSSVEDEVASKAYWRFYDDKGGIHTFTFENEKTLHYKNSIIEKRDLILQPVPEDEIIGIVNAFRERAKSGEPYEKYPEDKRNWLSPIPGVAFPKKAR